MMAREYPQTTTKDYDELNDNDNDNYERSEIMLITTFYLYPPLRFCGKTEASVRGAVGVGIMGKKRRLALPERQNCRLVH